MNSLQELWSSGDTPSINKQPCTVCAAEGYANMLLSDLQCLHPPQWCRMVTGIATCAMTHSAMSTGSAALTPFCLRGVVTHTTLTMQNTCAHTCSCKSARSWSTAAC